MTMVAHGRPRGKRGQQLRAVEDPNGYFGELSRQACIAWVQMLEAIPPAPEGHHYDPRLEVRPNASDPGATLVITACLVKTYLGADR